ncbi:chitinase [Kocuria sp. KH4]
MSVILGVGLMTGCAGQGDFEMAQSWFGGYVHVTSTPRYEFETQDASGQGRPVLSFVVADPKDSCAPSWGGSSGLEEARTTFGLDAAVETLYEQGGAAVVAFGGQSGTELATACEDPQALSGAYGAVVERYGVDTVDFDVEADDLGNSAANTRRAEAVAQLQQQRPEGDPLQVWVTVPVGPQGLAEDAQDVVAQMLRAGVELAGVNLMTMNYGDGKASDQSLYEIAAASARAAQTQVKDLYEQAGQSLSEEQAWQHIGLTPMIGHNDVEGEVFTLEDAQQLNRFAREQGIGRLSFWSLNRDQPCAEADHGSPWVSASCSGLEEETGAFARVLGEGFSQ